MHTYIINPITDKELQELAEEYSHPNFEVFQPITNTKDFLEVARQLLIP